MTQPLTMEATLCPLGCPPDDIAVLTGRDRLHDLPGTFTVVRCRHCGLLRTSPRPTADAIGLYYPDSYGPYASTRATEGVASNAQPVSSWRRTLRRVFDPKTHILPDLSAGRLLEVGCGSGRFLARMAQVGWDVEGLELSPSAGEAARRLGMPVFIGGLDAAPDPARPYDLIVAWMVLEHLHDPVAMLEKLGRWSAPGAWLVLSVPDAGALEFKLFRDAWYALDVPRHLYHFTPRTVRRVLARAGWRTERIFWHDNPNNLLLSLGNRCDERGWTRAATYWRDMADGKRQPRIRMLLGKILGALHASGRMTIWARRTSG